jgi:uncharacterized lipoprotein YmbA
MSDLYVRDIAPETLAALDYKAILENTSRQKMIKAMLEQWARPFEEKLKASMEEYWHDSQADASPACTDVDDASNLPVPADEEETSFP